MSPFIDYEKLLEESQAKNDAYLDEFWEDLTKAGLKESTISRHYQNADFYINRYLLHDGLSQMTVGTDSEVICEFLGNFFIRKCMWSTPATIKSTAASLKKFYKSMLQRGHIQKHDYTELVDTISIYMDSWLADCEAFNDPDQPNPFAFF